MSEVNFFEFSHVHGRQISQKKHCLIFEIPVFGFPVKVKTSLIVSREGISDLKQYLNEDTLANLSSCLGKLLVSLHNHLVPVCQHGMGTSAQVKPSNITDECKLYRFKQISNECHVTWGR